MKEAKIRSVLPFLRICCCRKLPVIEDEVDMETEPDAELEEEPLELNPVMAN